MPGMADTQRILILGCSGAGKSTLAVALGERLGLPVIHLDQHYWRPGWVEPSKDEWRGQVGALVGQPRWIMDGNYGGTIPQRLARADAVIVLDFPTPLCFWRVLRRTVSGFGRTRADLADGCPEHLDFAFLLYVLRFRRRSRPGLMRALEGFAGPVTMLTAPGQVAALLATLPSQQLQAATSAD